MKLLLLILVISNNIRTTICKEFIIINQTKITYFEINKEICGIITDEKGKLENEVNIMELDFKNINNLIIMFAFYLLIALTSLILLIYYYNATKIFN